MKVSDLEGAELDYWVAKAEGWEHEKVDDDPKAGYWIGSGTHIALYLFNPSTDWEYGGPIIEREKIRLNLGDDRGRWEGSIQVGTEKADHGEQEVLVFGFGSTPLIAAMRAYVASKYGEEVKDEKN